MASSSVQRERSRAIVLLCDWLPPEFGAVGQYALQFAGELAREGHQVTLIGFTSGREHTVEEKCEPGRLLIRRLHRPTYRKSALLQRALWTIGANLTLLGRGLRDLRRCDEVRFTGSPPFLIHFIVPFALLFRLRTRYRITDFHPECLMAAMSRRPLAIRMVYAVTCFWRRRVDVVEVLGEDQRARLLECGVRAERIELRRDPSPVSFDSQVAPAAPPEPIRGRKIILYSGNWGVAHDHETFVEGFARFCASHPDVAGVWLNATGDRADLVEEELRRRGLPHARSKPAPLERLPGILRAADVHLITLDDRFVGYVLPSKVYACVESGRPVLFIGSDASDVHLVCSRGLPQAQYQRVGVGDADAVSRALERLLLRN